MGTWSKPLEVRRLGSTLSIVCRHTDSSCAFDCKVAQHLATIRIILELRWGQFQSGTVECDLISKNGTTRLRNRKPLGRQRAKQIHMTGTVWFEVLVFLCLFLFTKLYCLSEKSVSLPSKWEYIHCGHGLGRSPSKHQALLLDLRQTHSIHENVQCYSEELKKKKK